MTELYGDWPKIKARVDGEAKGAPLLRELYAELQRRKAGFEGTFLAVFREMTGYPESEKLTGTGRKLNNSFWGLKTELLRAGKLTIVGKQSGVTVYRISAEDGPPTGTWQRPQTWRDNAMEAIRELTPSQFEHLVAAWAKGLTGAKPKVTPPRGDGGFDVVVSFPLVDSKVRIEAKLWNTAKVGSPEVARLRGALKSRRGDKGILIAPGGFTKAAVAEAEAEGKAPIRLVDRNELLDDMKKYKLGLKVEMVEQVTVDRDWFRSLGK